MTDDYQIRTPGIGHRVTVLEVEMRTHLQASQRLHEDAQRLMDKMDARLDRQDTLTAKLLGGLAVAVVVGQILAPSIASLLGIKP